MQLDTTHSVDDELLDALLDHFTINPAADLSVVMVQVDQLRAVQSSGVKREQRQTEQQQQRAADLQRRWADVTHAAQPHDDHNAAVDALTTDTERFFQRLVSSADQGKTRNGWRALSAADLTPPSYAPDVVTSTLSPLLAHLTSSSTAGSGEKEGNSDENSSKEASWRLRRAYLRLLPLTFCAAVPQSFTALDVAAQGTSEAHVVAWYRRYTTDPNLRQLLSPYVSETVDPLAKELRYHFRPGRETAVLHEPQHFFSFLFDCVERQQRTHQEAWASVVLSQQAPPLTSSSATSPPPPTALLHLLRCVGELALCAAAVVAFQRCYGWHPHSSLWRCTDYVVVTVNAMLDFVARVEGRLCSDAVALLLGHLLVEEVMLTYADAGVTMAAVALQNGPSRLWRRSFLTDAAPQPRFPLYTSSLHMVLALEALLRRLLSTLFLVEPAYAALMWRKTVEPALSHFFEVAEAEATATLDGAAGEDEARAASISTWETVLALQWCVASVQVVATAAEDWLGMLRESIVSSASSQQQRQQQPSSSSSSRFASDTPRPHNKDAAVALVTSDALDGLVLLRDRLARHAAEQTRALTRQLCTHKSADAALAAKLLHGLEWYLQQLETLPEGSSRYVMQAVILGVVQESLPGEQQAGLATFASYSGLPHVFRLLSSS